MGTPRKQQFEIIWIEKNKDGSETQESIKTGASSFEDAKKQIETAFTPVEIKSITKLI